MHRAKQMDVKMKGVGLRKKNTELFRGRQTNTHTHTHTQIPLFSDFAVISA